MNGKKCRVSFSGYKLPGGPGIHQLRAFQEQSPDKGDKAADHKKGKCPQGFKQISIYKKPDH
jgi:hypothetical protein